MSSHVDSHSHIETHPHLGPAELENAPSWSTLVVHQLMAILLLAFFDVLGALLPLYVRNLANRTWLQCLSCFGGGSLLALALVDILPHCRSAFAATGRLYLGPLELTYLLHFLGFGFLWVIESLIGHSHSHAPHPHGETEAQDLAHGHEHAHGHGHGRAQGEAQPARAKVMSRVPVLASLGGLIFHALCEGVVIGQMRRLASLWLCVMSISGHKWMESFCIAMALLRTPSGKGLIPYAVTALVLATAAGVAMGAVMMQTGRFFSNVLGALGNGTILYVGCQLLFEEMHGDSRRGAFFRTASFFLGSSLVIGTVAAEHSFTHIH